MRRSPRPSRVRLHATVLLRTAAASDCPGGFPLRALSLAGASAQRSTARRAYRRPPVYGLRALYLFPLAKEDADVVPFVFRYLAWFTEQTDTTLFRLNFGWRRTGEMARPQRGTAPEVGGAALHSVTGCPHSTIVAPGCRHHPLVESAQDDPAREMFHAGRCGF
jgi:hypothetical protein